MEELEKTVFGSNAFMSLPIGNIDIKVEVDFKRKLNKEETWMVSEFINKLRGEIVKNTLITDPETIQRLAEERKLILSCFESPIYVEEIPNGYLSAIVDPWFIVTTHKGRIKIGWRKSVMSIDWSDSDIKASAENLFPERTMTKYENSLHVSDYNDAKTVLNRLLS